MRMGRYEALYGLGCRPGGQATAIVSSGRGATWRGNGTPHLAFWTAGKENGTERNATGLLGFFYRGYECHVVDGIAGQKSLRNAKRV